MKIRITGASNFVNRMFEACGNFQWAREFLRNSLEAQATRVEFGIEWQAVQKHGVYRRTIADDGIGMSRDELLDYFSTLGQGSKRIGGVHDNFGVGARIASLPWNPEGVVVLSMKGGKLSMIWIVLDPDSGDYELVEFQTGESTSCVIDPTVVEWLEDEIDWGAVFPAWWEDRGTMVVLLGSEEYPDTVLGNPDSGEAGIKGLSVYLNTRFWDLAHTEVKVVELRSELKNSWPLGPDERDDARRPNNRTIKGARHYVEDLTSSSGRLAHSDVTMLDDDRVAAEWYLWEGDRPAVDSYAKKNGYIAVRYKGELYQLSAGKVHYRWFGIIEGEVQRNLWIILEPNLFQRSNGRWGVHPDQSRNRLIFTGNGVKGAELPISDWGLDFAEGLPGPVLDAIRAARGNHSAELTDEEYRKRLQDQFGTRWRMKTLVATEKPQTQQLAVVPEMPEIESMPDVEIPRAADRPEPRQPRKRKKAVKVLRRRARPNGDDPGVMKEVPVDVPRIRMAGRDEFEKPWHIASWVPRDPEGPTVVINRDSPILQEVVEYHQERYPDVYAEEVGKIVRQVFGEVAACKVAHSQKLTREVAEEVLDREYRNEAALTVGVMGLIAEESLIAQRLTRLGRKKAS